MAAFLAARVLSVLPSIRNKTACCVMMSIDRVKCVLFCSVIMLFLTTTAGAIGECPSPFALGMESEFIADNMITSSGHVSGAQKASNARLNHEKNWGVGNDGNHWLQVDFIMITAVVRVITQGYRPRNWVKTYQISYLYNTSEFQYYEENGITKTFVGNTDEESVVTNSFYPPIVARKIRLHPMSWKQYSKLRVEYLGCYHVCSQPLGMESGAIQDSQLSASSEDFTYKVGNARLRGQGGWKSTKKDREKPWYQIDFKINATVKVIATQGSAVAVARVKSFFVTYSYDGTHFHDYVQNGNKTIFSANVWTAAVPVGNILDPPIVARFVRVHFVEILKGGYLRMELYGCYENCSNPQTLGVARRGTFPDSQIHASSYNDAMLSPRSARLSPPADCIGWRVASGDTERWIQVDFLRSTKVTAILTQGRSDANDWISKYVVMYGNDGVHFGKVLAGDAKPKIFSGSTTRFTVVKNTMRSAIFARFVRLKAITWSIFAAARLEFEGRYVDSDWENTFPMGMENRLILDSQLSASSSKYLKSGVGNARLNMVTSEDAFGGWIAADDDLDPWLQIDFIVEASINAIRVQRVDLHAHGVYSFHVSYGNNESSIMMCKENGLARRIHGVPNHGSDVKTYLQPAITARFLRIHPTYCASSCCMKVEFYGHYPGCKNPEELGLGSAPYKILGSQISSSSPPPAIDDFARLDQPYGWVDKTNKPGTWIQVDFLTPTKVCRIDSLGRGGSNQFVKTFTVSFSNDALNYENYMEDGNVKLFHANYYADNLATQHLARSIFSRLIRLHPKEYWSRMAMRLEFWGCYIATDWFDSYDLSMENGFILDSQITTSSAQDSSCGGSKARLNSDTNTSSAGGWIARDYDANPWLQVDFIANVTLTSIVTQGIAGNTSRVTKFTVAYGFDRMNFSNYIQDGAIKVFLANYENNSTIRSYVSPSFTARFVRIQPKAWNGSCAMRVEFFGRYEGSGIVRELGMQSGAIEDTQITTSTAFSSSYDGTHARLNSAGFWVPKWQFDTTPWLQVDFVTMTFVSGIITKGRGSDNKYTRSFEVSFCKDGVNFQYYKELGRVKLFMGNYDSQTAVQQKLANFLFTRYLRLHPKSYSDYHAVRVEFLGFPIFTDWFDAVPLGMKSNLILPWQFAASSSSSFGVRAPEARKEASAWMAPAEDFEPWLQIDFKVIATVVAVATRGYPDNENWVKNYTLAFSIENNVWQDYKQNGQIKIFQANLDCCSQVKNDIYPYIVSLLLRIKPKTCKGYCSLGMEVYGKYDAACDNPRPLGMANHEIEDKQITASSTKYSKHAPHFGRLNMTRSGGVMPGWTPDSDDHEHWFQVSFPRFVKILEILTQGATYDNDWVKKFTVSYSYDAGTTFAKYKENGIDKEFVANHDRNTIARNRLTSPLHLQYIRLYIVESSGDISLRVEFVGCYLEATLNPAYEISSLLVDSQFMASSEQASLGGAAAAKHNAGGWVAADVDVHPWLQVDFLTNVTIVAMTSKKGDNLDHYVTAFTVAYSYGSEFFNYTQCGQTTKIFIGHGHNQSSAVFYDFYPVMLARYVRIKPETWMGKCVMEVEYYGRYECDNPRPLGVEDGSIYDGQLTASSYAHWTAKAVYGRLNQPGGTWSSVGGWVPSSPESSEWIQVDLLNHVKITGVSSQGRDYPYTDDYTKTFKVSTSNDGENFVEYKESAIVKIFQANFDRYTVVRQTFNNIIFARFIRLHPLTFNLQKPVLRIEIYGCYVEYTCLHPRALGMENYLIQDAQLTSSTAKDQTTRAVNARLNLEAVVGNRTGAWIALDTDLQPWLRIDFVANITLAVISTQGREDADEWVTSYEISFGMDPKRYEYYEENEVTKIFEANNDSSSVVKYHIFPRIFARYVRLHPKTWQGACAVRTEVYGCYEGCDNPSPLGLENEYVANHQFNASSSDKLNKPHDARLNQANPTGWLAADVEEDIWLQVDFTQFTKVTDILIQSHETARRWTELFTVLYSNDKTNFEAYKEFGLIKQFNGNFYHIGITRHSLTRVIFAHCIRILPKQWKGHSPAARLEFWGCYYGCHNPRELGMANGRIRDYQIKSSVAFFGNNSGQTARLFSDAGWMKVPVEGRIQLAVDFMAKTVITSIKTQGMFNQEAWVTTFKFAFLYGDSIIGYEKNKIFNGNNDSNTVATNEFIPVVATTRFVVKPLTWSVGGMGLRFELYGCYEDMDVCASSPCLNGGTCHDYFDGYNSFNCTCAPGFTGIFCETECFEPRALGMEHGQIKDSQIKSSPAYNNEYLAQYGRLNAVLENSRGCWCPSNGDINAWFQVEFTVDTTVTSVRTQGNPASNVDERVTTFEVSYSLDGGEFVYYKENGLVKVFNGNAKKDTVVSNYFSTPISARYIRIHPITYSGLQKGCLRVEFKGCYAILTCYYPHALGMKIGQILDSQITASSSRNDSYAPKRGRLKNVPFIKRGEWMPLADDNQYFRVNFLVNTTVNMIQIQARESSNDGIKYYALSYKQDGAAGGFKFYKDVNHAWVLHKFLKGSTEQGVVVNNTLTPVIFARYITILPQECTGACALRAEFYGCYEDIDVCASSPCQHDGVCHDHFDFFNYFTCTCAVGYTGEACETDINECMSYPCLNYGTCSDLVNAYNCSCPIDYYGIHCQYEYIYPIENFNVQHLAAQKFAENISLVLDLDEGSYTSVEVYYNEILCCNETNLHRVGGHCNCLITDPALFDPDGVVDMRIFVWNSISNETVNIEVEVLKDIQNPAISMLTSYATFGAGVNGRGSLQNTFPAEYPVVFNVGYQGGPATSVTWDFNCDVTGLTQEFDFRFDKSFPSNVSQGCSITVILQNNISQASAIGSVILKESTLFTSISNDGPVKINNTIRLTILFDKFAPETCMWIDVGDNSSLLVFGEVSCATKFSVAQINPNIAAEPLQEFYPKTPDTRQIVIEHGYPEVGLFRVRMNASNDVSMVTDETVAVILALECENPNITINGMAPNASNILNAAQVYRSLPISLSTELQINCEITEETTVTWTVFQFVDDPGMLATFPGLTVSRLQKTAYHSSIRTNDLLLPPRDLPYGFYEIVARVEMKGLPDVFGSDSFFIQVVQTPWMEAAVVGGSFYTVPYGLNGSLNASASVDPDFLGITDGMEFFWLCRDVDDHDFVISNLNSEPVLAFPELPGPNVVPAQTTGNDTEVSGCFGTGRGRLDSNDLILELDTLTMTEDKTYTISLYIRKTHPEFGQRQHMTNIFFYVARGLPPALQTNCYRNCKSKVIHDEKIILRSFCDARCYGELSFSWRLFLYDNIYMPEPYNLTELNEIANDEFEQMACNPTDGLDIGIKPYSLEPGKKYILNFKAMRPSGVYGELRHTMLINTPPQNGNCSIFPSSGLAAETNFTISCENWMDVDAPLSYEFSYETQGVKVVLFYRTIGSRQAVSDTDWLAMGDENNEYKLNVSVAVKDFFGSKSVQVMTVQAYPPPEPTLNMGRLMGLISGENNLLQKYFDSNRNPKAFSLFTTIGLILNHVARNKTYGNETNSDGEISSAQIRAKILTTIAARNLSVDSSAMKQVSATVLTLTKKPDELTPESQDAALHICQSLSGVLKKLSDSDNGFGQIVTSASFLLGCLGQMNNASTKAAQLTPDRKKRSISILIELQNIVTDNVVTSEGPIVIETETLSLKVELIMVKDIGQKKSTLRNCDFKPPEASALGLQEIIENPNNTVLQMQPINLKLAVFSKNPFTWDNTSETITSNVVDIVMESNMNISTSNFSEEASMTVARDSSQFPEADSFYMKPSETNTTANTKEYLKYHCFNRSSNYTSMNFEIHPEDIGIDLKVYLKRGGKPGVKSGDFELFYELPDLSSCSVENDISHGTSEPVYVDLRHCSRDPYTVFVSNQDFNSTGEHCFAVQHIQSLNESSSSDTDSGSRKRRSVSCEVGARRVRRSCVIVPPAPPKPVYSPPIKILVADNLGFDGKFFFPNQTPNYNLTMFESSCMHWDVENETWTGEGCRVAPDTNKDRIVCYCNHLTSFGSDLLVAPNPIDFDSVFSNFGSLAENVAVLALISTILGVYILGVIWARRADERDLLMLGPTILSKPKGSYHYLISTYTGSRKGAGTTARVVFKMAGDEGETVPVRLRDRHRPCFERGQENAFLVSYPKEVGDLSYLQIWHDNSGSSPSWYLSRMMVKDLQTGKTWPLFCENWLAVESEDGKVCRVLPVANEQEMISFGHLFSARAIKGLADGHIWFSIVSRPPTSNFTRVQRLSCALCLLCCTMITSAMFYNMGGQGPSPFAVHIGSLVIDLKPFVIGLQSSIIIIPVNVLIVQIFRNLRPKNEGEKNEDKNEKDVDDEKPDLPKGKLPHWFIFIAYAICYLASAASIFFTLLYSIQWGKETSTEWVIAMVTSFLQSALLLQPIKVVVAAVVFALIIRKPADTEEESNNVSVENIPAKNRRINEIPEKLKKKSKKYYSPPDPESLKEAREKRLKEIKMNAALKEIFAFFFFLILLMDVAQYHRDPDTFLLTKTLSETFEELDAFGIDLSAVSDTDSLWMWSRETLVPGLYATEWYNGKKIKKGWLANMEDYLVGVPRIRLLRVEQDSCPVSSYFEDRISHCYDGYSVSGEEDGTYNVAWESLDTSSRKRRDTNGDMNEDINSPLTEVEWSAIMTNGSNTDIDEPKTRMKRALDPIMGGTSGRKRRKKKRLLASSSPKIYSINDNALLPDGRVLSCLERWRHQTMLELRGFPNWGTVAWYSGSGYATNLGYDQETSYTVIADLHSNGWIDVQTRAVFVEFTVYNANTNLFGIITIFIEFLPSSSAITKVDFQSSRFYLHLTGGQTLAHVLVIFFMLYFLYREGKLVYKQRLAYFKGFWNWIETVLVISEFALIILFLARLYEVDRNLLQLRENPKDYVGFQYAGQADSFMTVVLGVLVFFYIIRFLRILRFNKNFLVIGRTLSRISSPILNFCVPFIFGFFAFSLFAYSVFSSELEDYSSFIRTMVTQFSMTLGDFDFEAIFMVNPALATLYFFAFIGLNVMVLMNMFIAIINDTYAEIQEETAEIENEFEIVDYVVGNLGMLTNGVYSKLKGGKVSPSVNKKRKKTRKTKKNDKSKKYFVLDDGPDLDSQAARLDRLVDSMNKGLEEDEVINDQFCSVPQERKDLFFRVLCLMEETANDDFSDTDDDWSGLSDESFNDN